MKTIKVLSLATALLVAGTSAFAGSTTVKNEGKCCIKPTCSCTKADCKGNCNHGCGQHK